ncbi:MAG: hypothetical protein IH621_01550 [Krumholzibacteria bacterium]|nr:hypothetical protein [Candidatus Krumholzibacteria bacterium]
METRMRKAGLALSVLLILPGTGALAGEVVKDGVLHIENGAEPAKGRRTVQLQEQWRVGGEDGEDFFGLISQLVVGDDGTIYLLDTRLSEVAVYSPAGERLGTLSREGEGPGESRMPANLLFLPDGSLGLLQIFPGRIVKVGLDGSPQGVVDFGDRTEGGFLQLFDCATQGDRLVVSGEQIRQNPPTGQIRTSFAAAYGLDGKELVKYEAHQRELDFTQFNWVEDELQQIDFRKSAVGRDGRVYLAGSRNAYRIAVYKPDGTPDRVITRPYQHREREAKEIERLETTLKTQLAQLPGAKWSISKTEPDIGALRIGPDGNLWVETSRGGVDQPAGVFYTWDVFDPDGHFVEQVSAACPGDGRKDMMIWTGDGAIQVTGFMDAVQSLQSGGAGAAEDDAEAAPMEVICYRISGK